MKVVHKIIYLIRRSPFNRVLYDFINKDSTVLRVYNKLMKKSGQREYFSTEAKEKLVNLLKKDIKKLDNKSNCIFYNMCRVLYGQVYFLIQ